MFSSKETSIRRNNMATKEIKVLMVEPGKHPKVTTLKNDLDSLQKALSIGADYQGLIEIISIGNGDNRLVAGGDLVATGGYRTDLEIIKALFGWNRAEDRGLFS